MEQGAARERGAIHPDAQARQRVGDRQAGEGDREHVRVDADVAVLDEAAREAKAPVPLEHTRAGAHLRNPLARLPVRFPVSHSIPSRFGRMLSAARLHPPGPFALRADRVQTRPLFPGSRAL